MPAPIFLPRAPGEPFPWVLWVGLTLRGTLYSLGLIYILNALGFA